MPGLYLYTGNRLEQLVERLAGLVAAQPLPPLQQEIVVVQSRGMERWLCLELARRTGVCANIAFPFPRALFTAVCRQAAGLPDPSPFDPGVLVWRIMALLPELLQHPAAGIVRRYCAGDQADLKRFQLASRIAAVFDQYLIYRPDMIAGWDRGDECCCPQTAHSAWQYRLWRMLSLPDALHPAALQARVVRRINDGSFMPDLPPRISVFGISYLPAFYLEFFSALSSVVDVHFFYVNPCREYWRYIYTQKQIERFMEGGMEEQDLYYESGNSLLASWGASGREFFSLVEQMQETASHDLFIEPESGTLLSCIQSDILNLRERVAGPGEAAAADGSIQIHSCYSPLREVEVLHDNLLGLFDRDRTLQPHDVVVMVPDIRTYAPLVQAVFDTPDDPALRIPYRISDVSVGLETGIAAVLQSVLELDRRRFSATALLDILAHPAVHQRFGIDDADVQRAARWVAEAGIRWGIDAAYRRRLSMPDVHENTWRFGLDRLLLGYGMPAGEDLFETFGGVLPCGDVEDEAARALGAFTRFFETIAAWSRNLEHPRPAAAWARDVSRLLDELFAPYGEAVDDIARVRSMLGAEGLAAEAAAAGFAEVIPRDVVCAYLKERCAAELKHHGFLSNGVTFCTMLPMRSIPFRVVYLLGMNDGDYPRAEQRAGFDLMEARRRPGDRCKRNEDRYLFLEALLSARSHFIVSYVGRSITDNTALPPSVLVSELLDYVRRGFGNVRLTIEHPLQPFSPRYFGDDPALFSYASHNSRAAAAAVRQDRLQPLFVPRPLPDPPADRLDDLTLDDLIRFFCNPCRFFIRERLGAALRLEDDPEPEDRDPFEPDALQLYRLRQDMLAACLAGKDLTVLFPAVKASGMLPPGASAKVLYRRLRRETEEFAGRIRSITQNHPPERRDISIAAGQHMVSGTVAGIYGSQHLLYRNATVKPDDLIAGWIRHLGLCAADRMAATVVMGRDSEARFKPLAVSAARDHLAALCGLLRRGLTEPLPLLPRASHAFAEARFKDGKSADSAYQKARTAWRPQFGGGPGDSDDTDISACFGAELPEGDAFENLAEAVWKPIFRCMEKIKA